MPARFTATWEGIPVFDRAFLKVENALGDFRPVWDEIAETWWYPMMADQFHSAGAAGGTPWKDLSDAYVEWKAAHGWGGAAYVSILMLTEDMRKSFMVKGAKDNIDRRERNFAEFGSSDRKARWHQEGVPSRHLPQRQLVVINDPRRKALQKAIQRSLVKSMSDGSGLVQRTFEL